MSHSSSFLLLFLICLARLQEASSGGQGGWRSESVCVRGLDIGGILPVPCTPHPRTSTAPHYICWLSQHVASMAVMSLWSQANFSGNPSFQRQSSVSSGSNTVKCYLHFGVRVFPQNPLHLPAVLFHFISLREGVWQKGRMFFGLRLQRCSILFSLGC